MENVEQPERRELSYHRLSDVLEDAEQLAKGEYRTTGTWSFGQILWHLGATYDASFTGFGFMVPFWARLFIAPFVKKGFLTKPMRAGFELGEKAQALVPGPDLTTEDGLEKLRSAIKLFETGEPNQPHPFFGKMTPDEWLQLHLRHAELHMSFVWPA